MRRVLFLLFFIWLFHLASNCQQLDWGDTIHYSATTTADGVACDQAGNVIVAGNHLVSYKLSGGGTFIRKYSPSGNLLWEDSSYATNTTKVVGLVVDSQGSSYFAVYLYKASNSITFAGTTYTASNPTMFLVKYNSSGQVVWVKNQANYSQPWGMTIDNDDFIYVSGDWMGGGFITKYDTSGNLVKTISIAGGRDIAVDANKNIYVIIGNSVNKYDSAGTLLWTVAHPPSRIACDSIGNCYISDIGYYGSTMVVKSYPNGTAAWTFSVPYSGSWAINTNSNNGFCIAGYNSSNMIIEEYSPGGTQLWSLSLPKCGPSDLCTYQNNLYLICNSGYPTFNGYLYKITMPVTASVKEEIRTSSSLSVFPNPSGSVFNFSYKAENPEKINLKITDSGGKLVQCRTFSSFTGELTEKVDLSGFAPGIYFLEISSDTHREVKKLVVQ